MGALLDDLSEFIVNNDVLKDLSLESEAPVSLDQSTVLSRAIADAQPARLSIGNCNFENDGSFERMLEGCSLG